MSVVSGLTFQNVPLLQFFSCRPLAQSSAKKVQDQFLDHITSSSAHCLWSFFEVWKAEQKVPTLLHYALGVPGPCVTQTMLHFCSFLCVQPMKDALRYVILGTALPPLPQAELLGVKLHRCLHLISFLPCLLPDSHKHF